MWLKIGLAVTTGVKRWTITFLQKALQGLFFYNASFRRSPTFNPPEPLVMDQTEDLSSNRLADAWAELQGYAQWSSPLETDAIAWRLLTRSFAAP
jgi:hypothetical protein